MKSKGKSREGKLVPDDHRSGMLTMMLVFGLLIGAMIAASVFVGNVGRYDGAVTELRDASEPSTIDPSDDTINIVTGTARFSGRESPQLCEGKIRFPQRTIVQTCEGYFSDVQVGNDTTTIVPRHQPLRRRYAFCGQDEWARRLQVIEKFGIREESLDVPINGIQVQRQRGLAISRINGKYLGNKEYTDWLAYTEQYLETHPHASLVNGGSGHVFSSEVTDGSGDMRSVYQQEVSRRQHIPLVNGDVVCWTGDFREHYVLGHNTVPSEEFYRYVLIKFDILKRDASRMG